MFACAAEKRARKKVKRVNNKKRKKGQWLFSKGKKSTTNINAPLLTTQHPHYAFFFFLPSLHNSFNRSVTREEKKDNRTDGYERTRA